MKTIIHVNQHVIKANRKNNANDPVLTAKQGKNNTYGYEVIIDGPSKVVYNAEKPLSCGAQVWIETESNVKIIGARKYERNKNEVKANRQSSDVQAI